VDTVRVEQTQDVERLRGFFDVWTQTAHGDEFGIDIDTDSILAQIDMRLTFGKGVILIAIDSNDNPAGFFVVETYASGLGGKQTFAGESFWFALPNRVMAGPYLAKAAKKWAKENGCSHLTISGSRLASDLHDKVCNFCERMDMKPIETVYITEVA
jgi:hypothetical protein